MDSGLVDILQSPNYFLSSNGQYFNNMANSWASAFPNVEFTKRPPCSIHFENSPSYNESIPRIASDKTGERREGKRIKPDSESARLRRRVQNRASQQAFRERKRLHVEGIETQMNILLKNHQKLQNSFMQQTDIFKRFKSQMMDLTAELEILHLICDQSFFSLPVPSEIGKSNASTGYEMHHTFSAYFDLATEDPDPYFNLAIAEDCQWLA